MNRILILISMASTFALAQNATTHTQAEVDAHRAKIDQAIEARDYNTWKSEHEAWNPNDTRLTGKITADNFEQFAQMREARKSGDMTKAAQLREELGVSAGGQGNGKGKGQGQGQGKRMGKGNCDGTGTGSGSGSGQGHGKNR